MRLLWGVTEFILQPLDSCLKIVRIQYMVARTRGYDDDDDDFLLSLLPQYAQKTPHFRLDGIQSGLLSFC